ncbi:hypothetical protein H6G13_25925 [Pseudanabaena sp. FACHB-2040]|nr:hypothetical protein [Pseudanabaena sp. FACHB-2040]
MNFTRRNSLSNSSASNQEPERTNSVKPTLWEEIKRGWEWVVFVWKLLPRIGGIGAWIRTLFFIISLLINRLLIQWKIIKIKK